MTHAISPETIRGYAENLQAASQDAEKCLAHFEANIVPNSLANSDSQNEMRDLLRRVIDALAAAQHALKHELDPDHVDPTGGCPGCWSNGPSTVEVSQTNSSV